jgi:hypothetical protein
MSQVTSSLPASSSIMISFVDMVVQLWSWT